MITIELSVYFIIYLSMHTLIKKIYLNRIALLILILTSFLFTEFKYDNRIHNRLKAPKIGMGTSFGLWSERIPPTFLEITAYYIPDNNTEIFGTFSYLIFGGGIGAGAKFYLRDRTKTSPFVSLGFSASVLGDGLDTYVGPHIACGGYISFRKILEYISIDDSFNLGINGGIGKVFYRGTGAGLYIFLNGEMKFAIDI